MPFVAVLNTGRLCSKFGRHATKTSSALGLGVQVYKYCRLRPKVCRDIIKPRTSDLLLNERNDFVNTRTFVHTEFSIDIPPRTLRAEKNLQSPENESEIQT